MPIECELIPRSDLNPEQRQELANAFCYWAGPENGFETMDGYAAWCMLEGELPPTAAMGILHREMEVREACTTIHVAAKQANELVEEIERLRTQFEQTPSLRCLRFAVMSEGYNRRQQITVLREWLPESLLDDVLIDGRSWRGTLFLDHERSLVKARKPSGISHLGHTTAQRRVPARLGVG